MSAQVNDRDSVSSELLRCRKWIEDALEYSDGTHNFDDIIKSVLSGEMQLWPGKNSAMVTKLVPHPRKKILFIFLAGGELEELLEMCEQAQEWSKRQGCSGVSSTGRPGWERVMKKFGWTKTHVAIGKNYE